MELRHGPKAEHSSRWLQVSHTFQPSVPRLDVQLDQTTVSLAFNLEGEAPTQQQVYAFLPLRSYGLCFIIQVRASLRAFAGAIVCLEESGWGGRCMIETYLYMRPHWRKGVLRSALT